MKKIENKKQSLVTAVQVRVCWTEKVPITQDSLGPRRKRKKF